MREVILVKPNGEVLSEVPDTVHHDIRVGELIKKHFNKNYVIKDSMKDNSMHACEKYSLLVILDDERDMVNFFPKDVSMAQANYFLQNFMEETKRVHSVQFTGEKYKEIPYEKLESFLKKCLGKRVITVDPFGYVLESQDSNPNSTHDKMLYDMYQNFFQRNGMDYEHYVKNNVLYPHAMMLKDTLDIFAIFETNGKPESFFIPKNVTNEQLEFFKEHYLQNDKKEVLEILETRVKEEEKQNANYR